jgi:alkane 1-monooxygenase
MSGNYYQYLWVLVFLIIFLVGIDLLFGKEPFHPPFDRRKHQTKSIYYILIIYLSLPATITLSVCGTYFVSGAVGLHWSGRIIWTVLLGLFIALLGMPASHELIHRKAPIDRFIGSMLLAFLLNTAHRIEHIPGHHANVATPKDTGSAKFNQSYYHYLPRAFLKTIVNAWQIEKRRLDRRQKPVWIWRNELISWHAVSLGFAIAYYLIFGVLGLIFFVSQGLIAITAHQLINYIQHYGLMRLKLDNDRYEKFSTAHAWNCNFLISNWASFYLTHHPDHHLNPRRPYQIRQHHEDSPQMPMGYFGMFILALIPPLWFKIINQCLSAYAEEAQSNVNCRPYLKIEQPSPSMSIEVDRKRHEI